MSIDDPHKLIQQHSSLSFTLHARVQQQTSVVHREFARRRVYNVYATIVHKAACDMRYIQHWVKSELMSQ